MNSLCNIFARSATTTVTEFDENNNEVREREEFQTTRTSQFRQVLTWLAGLTFVGCLAVACIVVFVNNEGGGGSGSGGVPNINHTPLQAEAQLTRADVEALAARVGSPRLPKDELAKLEQAQEICYTQECLEAASSLLNSMNFSTNPCSDFYTFTCGQWIASNPIPESQSRWNQFNVLREEVNSITKDILTTPVSSGDPLPINQVKEFFKLCTNTSQLEVAGLDQLRTILKSFGDWPLISTVDNSGAAQWNSSAFKWMDLLANLRRTASVTAIIGAYVDQDLKSSDNYILYIDQPSLVLPRAMYLNGSFGFETELTAYKTYIKELAEHLAAAELATNPTGGSSSYRRRRSNSPEFDTEVNEVIEFETELAKLTTKAEDRTDSERMYNKFSLDEWQNQTELIGGEIEDLAWKPMLDLIFRTSNIVLRNNEPVIVAELEYFHNLILLLRRTSRRTVANYLHFRLVDAIASETTQEMRDAKFKFQQVLTGAKQPKSREQTCADVANENLGYAIGMKYVQQVFDDAAKSEVDEMVELLRVAFETILNNASTSNSGGWMDSSTLAKAKVKLSAMSKFMAFPDWVKDPQELEKYHAGLTIGNTSHFVNIEKLTTWCSDKDLKNLRLPVDLQGWLSPPTVVNAFYSPMRNSITFPAGILQAPFFKHGFPSSFNLGSIGAVIGHEITHGFDNSGSQFDELGNLVNWWTNETLDNFLDKAKCIENQYSEFRPPEVPDSHVNGKLTLGENIADNGGVRESYLAWQKYKEEHGNSDQRLPGLEQFDGDQLFFLGYSRIWCENITPQALENQMLTDPHSPARYRVQGPLVNNVAFAEKWNCASESEMNPDPGKRCILW